MDYQEHYCQHNVGLHTVLLNGILIILWSWYQFIEFHGPIGTSAGWDTFERPEASSQRGVCPAFLNEWVHSPLVCQMDLSGREESRRSECRALSRGGTTEELTNKLDVSFACLTCGRTWEIMKLSQT